MKVKIQVPDKDIGIKVFDSDTPILPEIGESVYVGNYGHRVFARNWHFSDEGEFMHVYIAASNESY
jgi:hypothetical protein